MPLLTLKEIADMFPVSRGRIGGAVGREDRHYCDEFRRKNDTEVVTWRSTAVVGWSWQTNTIPFPIEFFPRSENPDCFAFPSPKKELGKQFYITVMSSDRRESRHPFNKLH